VVSLRCGRKRRPPDEAVPARRAGANGAQRTALRSQAMGHRTMSGRPPVQTNGKLSATPGPCPTFRCKGSGASGPHDRADVPTKTRMSTGVTEARAHFAVRPGERRPKRHRAAGPMFEGTAISLVLPNARTRNGLGQTVNESERSQRGFLRRRRCSP